MCSYQIYVCERDEAASLLCTAFYDDRVGAMGLALCLLKRCAAVEVRGERGDNWRYQAEP